MAGWSRKKRELVEEAFYLFLGKCFVNSKDSGRICLGDSLYDGQRAFITAVFDSLEKDIHKIYVLKSRQLGLSTIARALSIFLIGVNPGLKGAIVFDSDINKAESRAEIEVMIEDLPKSLKFPPIKSTNRVGLTLANDSKVLFMSAGTRKSKTSGTLGRSVGLSLAHLCMHPDTPVLVADGRLKPIKEVSVGDAVLTHTGESAVVIANTGRLNASAGIKISPWMGQSIICTPEHKIPTARGLLPAGEITKRDLVLMPVRKIIQIFNCSFLPGNRAQHRGKVSAGSEMRLDFNEETGFAMGYYLAEGCLTYQRRDDRYYDYPSGVVFSRHRNEKAYADRAVAALRQFTTGGRTTTDKKGSLATTENLYSSALARWIDSVFGALDEKRIPDSVFQFGAPFCRGLLCGLLSGDGSKTATYAQKYETNTVNLSTTRASIAMQARDLAASLGYGWGSWRDQESGVRYGRNCKKQWTIGWYGGAAARLRELVGLPVAKGGHRYSEKYRVKDGFVYMKLRSVETVASLPIVYDLAVSHADHTFRTPSFAVSNSEICSYDNDEGLIAFENSLSDMNPDRLYVYESTARGFNIWHKIWERARKDPAHCCCLFLGWWSKPSQSIRRADFDFELYGLEPPTSDEIKKIEEVRELYGHQITVEQLAWIRRKMDPAASQITEDTDAEDDDPAMVQDQPWTESEAFQLTGSKFFPSKNLLDQTTLYVSNKFAGYACVAGQEFVDMQISKSENYRWTDLKVWEEPDPEGFYIVACDPAYGENENNDRSSIQVGRCYSDGVDQVAEYASPLINTRQLAWVIAALLGWYGAGKAEARYILELNGPGTAVFNEMRSLKFQIDNQYMGKAYEERGLQDIFRNVRTYIYTRPDGLGAGQNYHMKTNANLKVTIMEQLRSFVMSGLLRVRSMNAIKEMQSIARQGDSIGAPQSGRDDCVLALAFLTYYWDTGLRKQLIALKKTRESEKQRAELSIRDQVMLFGQNQLQSFFDKKRQQRHLDQRQLARAQWRNR